MTDYAQDYFSDFNRGNRWRLGGILSAAIVFALACGFLETPIPNAEQLKESAPIRDVAAVYIHGVTAKALSSLVSALGFATILSALAVELTGGWNFKYNITPSEYTVVDQEVKNSMKGYIKNIYFMDSDGRKKCITTNLSSTSSVLTESRMFAAQISVGDRIQVIESGEYRAIVGTVTNPVRV